ncbi:hypothetical protein [Pseudomonas sp. D2002]|uniref:hypothetical protein n=1 Tax=Pseudomonas sp. D2002 TaxID=2726980 RepID=UPI0015A0E2D0|nr:hypothetical protein [Pseudomonas sp. D2002]NWA82829.1 hypothetical protein [Pseudomonas sp. D2002]
MSVIQNSSPPLSAAHQQKLDEIGDKKGDELVREAERTAQQELTTAKAGRIKSLRFA